MNTRIMLTVNVDIGDRHINSQIGTVKHVLTNSNGNVIKLFIILDDYIACVKQMNNIYGFQ